MSFAPGPVLKKPKIEKEEAETSIADEYETENDRAEHELALVALIAHRTDVVELHQKRVAYYQSQLDEAESKLEDSQVKLARLRRNNTLPSKETLGDAMKNVKVEKTPSPTRISENSIKNQPQSKYAKDYINSIKNSVRNVVKDVKVEPRSTNDLQIREGSQHQSNSKPQLIIPAVNPKVSQPMKMEEPAPKASNGSGSRHKASVPTHVNSPLKVKEDAYHGKNSPEQKTVETNSKATKRKFEQKEHKDLIQMICRSSSPRTINCHTGTLIPSQHKRKLRSLVLCPTNDQLFVTSALDGVVNLWQIQGRGSHASFLSSTDCQSVKQRRWPEDIAWHPQGNSLFTVYSADGGDSQIALLNLNKTKEKPRVSFLEHKPHVKGIINNIEFMPWEDTCFVTGGSDHAVVLWSEKDVENSWKPKALHRAMHSSAVMGVAGMQHKQVVISVGVDKRIIGFDLMSGRGDYKHQIDSKCMSVLLNPCDFNLFMVQTGTPERQLCLFDYRVRQMEIHAFGWKQESSESQSALINQAWSPDGLYITSGSADPMIHIFDIRYNAAKPTQSIRAHHKRVFKAAWHHNLPLLISISSDLNIGLHKVM